MAVRVLSGFVELLSCVLCVCDKGGKCVPDSKWDLWVWGSGAFHTVTQVLVGRHGSVVG